LTDTGKSITIQIALFPWQRWSG